MKYSWLWKFLVYLLIFALLWGILVVPEKKKSMQMKQEVELLRKEYDTIAMQIKKLEEENALLRKKDSPTLTKIAREQGRKVREGETVFRFPKEEPNGK